MVRFNLVDRWGQGLYETNGVKADLSLSLTDNHNASSSSSSGCDGDLSSSMLWTSWPPSFLHHKERPHTCPGWFYNQRQEAPQVMLCMWPDVEFLRDATMTHQHGWCLSIPSISPRSLLQDGMFCRLWPECGTGLCRECFAEAVNAGTFSRVQFIEMIQTTFWISNWRGRVSSCHQLINWPHIVDCLPDCPTVTFLFYFCLIQYGVSGSTKLEHWFIRVTIAKTRKNRGFCTRTVLKESKD